MALTDSQKAILLQRPSFRQQAGIDNKTPESVSGQVNRDDIRKQLMGMGGGPTQVVTPSAPVIVKPPKTTTQQIGAGVLKGIGETLKGTMDTSEILLKEYAKQNVGPIFPLVNQLVKNFTGKTLEEHAPDKSMAEMLQSQIEKQKGMQEGELLKSKTPIEKVAKIGTEIGTAFIPLGEGRLASSAVGKAKSLLTIDGGKTLTKGSTKLEEYLTPKLTSKVKEGLIANATGKVDEAGNAILEQGPTAPGILTKGKITVNKFTQEMKDRVGHILKMDDPTLDKIRLDDFIAKESEKVGTAMKSKEGFITQNLKQLKTELTNLKNTAKVKLMLGKDSTKQGAWDTVMQVFNEATKGKTLNREGLYKVFQDFNKLSGEAKVYEGADNITKEALKAVRDGLRNKIVAGLPGSEGKELTGLAKIVDDSLLNQFYAIKAKDIIVKNGAETVGAPSKAREVIKKYAPGAAATLGLGGIGAGIGLFNK